MITHCSHVLVKEMETLTGPISKARNQKPDVCISNYDVL